MSCRVIFLLTTLLSSFPLYPPRSSVSDLAVPGVRDHPQLLRFKDSLRLESPCGCSITGGWEALSHVGCAGHLEGAGFWRRCCRSLIFSLSQRLLCSFCRQSFRCTRYAVNRIFTGRVAQGVFFATNGSLRSPLTTYICFLGPPVG